MENTSTDYRGATLGHLRLFVYGTLKRGYWNHDRFCRGALSIEEATVRGSLYELPSGIPVLAVTDKDILATGSLDPLSDVRIQDSVCVPKIVRNAGDPEEQPSIVGELVYLDDPEIRLPNIDQLEGFTPGAECLYRRALIGVTTSEGRSVAAWCYVLGRCLIGLQPTRKSIWSG